MLDLSENIWLFTFPSIFPVLMCFFLLFSYTIFFVGVALVYIGVALFLVGVAPTTPFICKVTHMIITLWRFWHEFSMQLM